MTIHIGMMVQYCSAESDLSVKVRPAIVFEIVENGILNLLVPYRPYLGKDMSSNVVDMIIKSDIRWGEKGNDWEWWQKIPSD